jgi:hypothetical protein
MRVSIFLLYAELILVFSQVLSSEGEGERRRGEEERERDFVCFYTAFS